MTRSILMNLLPLLCFVLIWVMYVKRYGFKLPPSQAASDNGSGPWVSTALLAVSLMNLYKPWVHLPYERTRLLTIGLFMIVITGLVFLQTIREKPRRAWGRYSNFCISAMLCSMAVSVVLQP